ncbi:adenylate/guanylate cyclase domain-containing protein [Spirulina sp. CS-785/01]|uniref:adenylate/guanylate cyclase domain-containing protein n=1 Tax=Spirulina sp. CS-785/01 TaxID=3021716 RepID=UPI00232EC3C6|nr:adenylate/guanylate cyclase domain-containing protein [Spirulina sp. CS-785/01]MDB9311711.1 adenylate/guanylate cyclase domain-containing protein [Spirulina sp. CS-785/01]
MTSTPDEQYLGNILIVDDTPANLRLLSKMLSERGYKVRSVMNGMMALNAAQAKLPDLILLDISMPEMSGYEVCEKLKENPRTAHIPVIFLSALDDINDKVHAFSTGGVDYITKPFHFEEVLVRVNNHLTLQKAQDELERQSRVLEFFGHNLKEIHRLNTTEYNNFADRTQDYLKTGAELLGFVVGFMSGISGDQYTIESVYSLMDFVKVRDQFSVADTYCARVLQNAETVAYDRVTDVAELTHCCETAFYKKYKFEAYLGTPIWVNNTIYGTLCFAASYPRLEGFCTQEKEIIELISQSLGKAISAHQTEQKRRDAEEALRIEQQKSEQLLLNILPQKIAKRLKQVKQSIAEQFNEATILFADIVGFTQLATQIKPIELVNFLNTIFSKFDSMAESMGVEKIKTVGDAYMLAGGLPVERKDHVSAIADMALAMQDTIQSYSIAIEDDQSQSHLQFQIRMGIHTGPVVAGVIGTSKFTYDLWGDTVNVASRMESTGDPGKIQVTEAVYQVLKADYWLEERGKVEVKGKGEMTTYWLLGKK